METFLLILSVLGTVVLWIFVIVGFLSLAFVIFISYAVSVSQDYEETFEEYDSNYFPDDQDQVILESHE